MEDTLKAIIKYEGKLFWVDLTVENWQVEVFNTDGTRRPATNEDANFMDLLWEGHVLAKSLEDFKPEMLN